MTTTAASMDDANFCFLEVSIAGRRPRRIIIQLYRETCPQTCQNFATLCAAPGRTCTSKPISAYRGSIFHRIVPQFMVQGGDFEHFNGTGGHSILSSSSKTFADESFAISHDKPGLLSMANKGKNTNGSQFFITLASTPHLNGKHVVFGQVVEGMDAVHSMATDVELEGTKPAAMQKIIIVDCGMGKGGESSSSDDSESISDRKKHRKEKKKKKSKDEKRKSHKSKKQKKRHSRESRKNKRGRDSYSDSDNSTASSRRDRKHEQRKYKDDDSKKKSKRSHSTSSKRQRDDNSSNSSVSSNDDPRKKKSHKKHHHRH